MNNARLIITRQEYDAAVAQLPDATSYPVPEVTVRVTRDVTQTNWRFYFEPSEALPAHPIAIFFEKVPPGEDLGAGLTDARACWRLAPWFRVI